jgi:hypothetical protein
MSFLQVVQKKKAKCYLARIDGNNLIIEISISHQTFKLDKSTEIEEINENERKRE